MIFFFVWSWHITNFFFFFFGASWKVVKRDLGDFSRPLMIYCSIFLCQVRLSLSRMLISFRDSDNFNKVHPVIFVPVGQHADRVGAENGSVVGLVGHWLAENVCMDEWLIQWFTDWLCVCECGCWWLVALVVHWFTEYVSVDDWLIQWFTDWLSMWVLMIGFFFQCFTHWLSLSVLRILGSVVHWFAEYVSVNDWLVLGSSTIGGFTDCGVCVCVDDWLVQWFTDWLEYVSVCDWLVFGLSGWLSMWVCRTGWFWVSLSGWNMCIEMIGCCSSTQLVSIWMLGFLQWMGYQLIAGLSAFWG